MALPALTAGLIAVISWRLAAAVVGIIALLGAAAILLAPWSVPAAGDRRIDVLPSNSEPNERADPPRSGFALLLIIGVIDSATRMGFLTFLPFLLVTALFFLWGVPNNLNDVLIRQFMKSFAITRFQAGLVP